MINGLTYAKITTLIIFWPDFWSEPNQTAVALSDASRRLRSRLMREAIHPAAEIFVWKLFNAEIKVHDLYSVAQGANLISHQPKWMRPLGCGLMGRGARRHFVIPKLPAIELIIKSILP